MLTRGFRLFPLLPLLPLRQERDELSAISFQRKAEISGWFTEGFDAADLQEVGTQLTELL